MSMYYISFYSPCIWAEKVLSNLHRHYPEFIRLNGKISIQCVAGSIPWCHLIIANLSLMFVLCLLGHSVRGFIPHALYFLCSCILLRCLYMVSVSLCHLCFCTMVVHLKSDFLQFELPVLFYYYYFFLFICTICRFKKLPLQLI